MNGFFFLFELAHCTDSFLNIRVQLENTFDKDQIHPLKYFLTYLLLKTYPRISCVMKYTSVSELELSLFLLDPTIYLISLLFLVLIKQITFFLINSFFIPLLKRVRKHIVIIIFLNTVPRSVDINHHIQIPMFLRVY